MQFVNKEALPQSIVDVIDKDDYVGYVRVYYSGGRYGSRLFFKDSANGTIDKIKEAEKRGMERYTPELKSALQSVCETLFEESNPTGRYELYDFCEKNQFDKTEAGWIGYCYLAHSAFLISVSKDDDYFCRVYFYDRENQ